MTYFLAPALVQLRAEVDKKFPHRDKSSDGWIGDASHAARPSDHNPCWSCSGRSEGIVRAIDLDISPDGRADKDMRAALLRNVVGDPRVYYVISNGIIYSRTYGFNARQYTGTNGHFAHVHVSLNGVNGVNPEGNFDTSPWFATRKPLPKKMIDLSILQHQMLIALGVERGQVRFTHAVRFTQMALNRKLKAGLETDGVAGQSTLNAWGKFEKARDGKGRPRIPDEKSLSLLVKGTNLSWKE